MAALDSLGLRENTVVLFLADNGTPPRYLSTAKDGRYVFQPFTSKLDGREITGGKGKLTDWGTRVPMMVLWPGKARPGTTTDALVDGSDILPTLAEIGGTRATEGELDGHSILPIVAGGPGSRKWVFMEYNGMAAVRDRRWKLYTDKRFFDLNSDPDEVSPVDLQNVSSEALSDHRELSQALDEFGYSKAHK
jgi:arylsulfatase A